jgi:hypothetical protein
MTEERFWELIAADVHVDDCFQVDLAGLRMTLKEMALDEIVAFEEVFWKKMHSGS